jgi:hypothetical protein
MSKNIIFVLMYHCHKILDLIFKSVVRPIVTISVETRVDTSKTNQLLETTQLLGNGSIAVT